MGLEMFYLSLKVKEMTKELEEELKRHQPVKMETKESDIELTIRDHDTALKILSILHSRGLLLNFEMSSASLEDVFVSLLDRTTTGAAS